jgi:4-hydroxy 2-oxovalerate aldolase
MKNLKIHDVTLRDGNHALRHQLTVRQAASYAKAANDAGIESIEVGHGNGLGGSSALIGFSFDSDIALIEAVASSGNFARVGVHSMPSFATISRDLKPAILAGANYFRLGAHCTEIDTVQQHFEFLASSGVMVSVAIMMVSHIHIDDLSMQIQKAIDFGVSELVLMDSAGRLSPADVRFVFSRLKRSWPNLSIGFHAHDNLGSAVANSLAALEEGASFVDASVLGMGAGAGNASLEALVCALALQPNADLLASAGESLRLAEQARGLGFVQPKRSSLSAATALANMFSGFAPIIENIAREKDINPIDLAMACTGRKLVAGQEDSLYEVAERMLGDKS